MGRTLEEGDLLLAIEAELAALRAAYKAVGAGQHQGWPYLAAAGEKLFTLAALAHQTVSLPPANVALDRSCDLAVAAMSAAEAEAIAYGDIESIISEIDQTIEEIWTG